MPRPTITITCACCGTPGLHWARGLIGSCYSRHTAHGTLNRFPRARRSAVWVPTTPKGKRTLAEYAELVAIKATPARIRWELSLSDRQRQRYAAAYRHLQNQQKAAA